MKIGVFGGTFDPPHRGHLEFAKAAIEQLGLDEVIYLPANRNPLKKLKSAPAKQRMEMVQLMAGGEPKMLVSDIDISRGGPSFMTETLSELQMVKPGDYWVLVGADALKRFDEWKNPEKILRQARLAVAIRPPAIEAEALAKFGPLSRERIDIIAAKPIDISSTELRDRCSKRGS